MEQWVYFTGIADGVVQVTGVDLWTITDGARCWLQIGTDGPESPRVVRAGWRTFKDVSDAFRGMWDALSVHVAR
jgi:hypothetical protein